MCLSRMCEGVTHAILFAVVACTGTYGGQAVPTLGANLRVCRITLAWHESIAEIGQFKKF